MNPMLSAALASILRWALTFLAGWFVQRGIWTGGEAEMYVAGAALALVTCVWSVWSRYRSRVKFLTALTMAPGATENDVKAHIKSGAATPTVHTPAHTVPGIPKESGE